MKDRSDQSYFHGLAWRLGSSVLIGSAILFLYYWKLLHFTPDQVRKAIYSLLIILVISLLWPVPFNRRLIRPIIRYLREQGSWNEAEEAAAALPLRSALLSLISWTLGSIGLAWSGKYILLLPTTGQLYVLVGGISAGIAASFVHFHILRNALEPLRVRLAEESDRPVHGLKYPIRRKLLLSITLVILLSLVFFALLGHDDKHESVQTTAQKMLFQQLQDWNRVLQKKPEMAAHLPAHMQISDQVPLKLESSQHVRLPDGRYLTATFPAILVGSIPETPWWETMLLIFMTVGVGGWVALFAAADISDHMHQIRDATRRIASGDFEHELKVVTDDEVAELATSINLMANDLRRKMTLLEEMKDEAQSKSIQLEEANRELMKLDQLKSDFLANISHELKAPLVSTKGYVDFILSGRLGPVNEKQTKGLAVSRDNLNHLSRLITSLLDFSRISTGAVKLRQQPCSVSALIESCMESVKIDIRRKNRRIETVSELPENLPQVFCDPDRIREVIMNLLVNAEKFTEDGGRIKIAIPPPSEEDDFLCVKVIDTGIGIDREHLHKIFQRFFQVDSSSTRKYGGTGLGLAIVKEIMEVHGCKIHVESEAGIGSKFTFTLPIHRHGQEHLPQRHFLRKRAHHASKLVEVVEDDAHLSGMIKMLLEEEGYAVIQARTAKDALLIAREHHPDLITMDVYLPDRSGFDVLEQLQSAPETSRIPVIILSILVDKERGFQLGAADYLEKPIDSGKLLETVRRISDAQDRKGEALHIMVVDDDQSTLDFFQDCLTEEGYKISTVSTGREALQLARNEKPDVILLDLVMPEMDGTEVLQGLKADSETKDIPVVVLTGLAGDEDREKSIRLGAEGVLAKPSALKDVVLQVKRYFGDEE